MYNNNYCCYSNFSSTKRAENEFFHNRFPESWSQTNMFERIDIYDLYFLGACKIRSVLLSVHADFFFHPMRIENLTNTEDWKKMCNDFIIFFYKFNEVKKIVTEFWKPSANICRRVHISIHKSSNRIHASVPLFKIFISEHASHIKKICIFVSKTIAGRKQGCQIKICGCHLEPLWQKYKTSRKPKPKLKHK